MARSLFPPALLAATLALAPAAQAKPSPLYVILRFSPTGTSAMAKPDGDMAWFAAPLTLKCTAPGDGLEHDLMGENREDRDPVPIYTHGSLSGFACQTLRDTLENWGGKLTEGAGLVLTMDLARAFVTETDWYVAEVRVRWTLRLSSGELLWEGTTLGSAKRTGRSLKPDNYNEVLSDGLLANYANLINDRGFREAMTSRKIKAAPAPPQEYKILSGPQLLEKLQYLKKEGFEDGILLAFVRQTRVVPALTAEDLVAWKQAGIPTSVIQAALGAQP